MRALQTFAVIPQLTSAFFLYTIHHQRAGKTRFAQSEHSVSSIATVEGVAN